MSQLIRRALPEVIGGLIVAAIVATVSALYVGAETWVILSCIGGGLWLVFLGDCCGAHRTILPDLHTSAMAKAGENTLLDSLSGKSQGFAPPGFKVHGVWHGIFSGADGLRIQTEGLSFRLVIDCNAGILQIGQLGGQGRIAQPGQVITSFE